MIIVSHARNSPIVVGPWNEVVVVEILRHDREEWIGMMNNTSFNSLIFTTPVTQQSPLPLTSNHLSHGTVGRFLFVLLSLVSINTHSFYYYLSLSRTDLHVSFLTHHVTHHITCSSYIVLSITCLYLSFLLSRNPTLLDPCVSVDKLGCLKSFYS